MIPPAAAPSQKPCEAIQMDRVWRYCALYAGHGGRHRTSDGHEWGGPSSAAPSVESLIDRLENYYDFQCEGGPLRLCADWQQLKSHIDHERSLVAEIQRLTDALKEVDRANSHRGAGPHCKCSQAERERIVSAALDLRGRGLTAALPETPHEKSKP